MNQERRDFLLMELTRRINNMVRRGRIHSVDLINVRARVQMGAIITDWLPWTVARAGRDRSWWAPSVGEQVLLVSESGDLRNGIITACFNSTTFPAPADADSVERITFRDGTVVEYDTEAHKLSANVQGNAELTTTGKAKVSAGSSIEATAGSTVSIEASGAVTIKGSSITLDAPVKATSTVSASGAISSSSDVRASTVSLKSHLHIGVMTGGGMTGTPL